MQLKPGISERPGMHSLSPAGADANSDQKAEGINIVPNGVGR
jgi:hypothetical protein